MPVDLKGAGPVALVCATLARNQAILEETRYRLESRIHSVRRQGPVYPFEYTSYYEREMGPSLIKQILWFEPLVDPAELPGIKHKTMELEREMAETREGKTRRRTNIDPGLVSLESMVLASTKYSGHRICIAPGLYAETTLLFQKGRFRPFDWTYPDYRTEAVQSFLQEVRTYLLQQRRPPPPKETHGQ